MPHFFPGVSVAIAMTCSIGDSSSGGPMVI
jgi:hypothetical protein